MFAFSFHLQLISFFQHFFFEIGSAGILYYIFFWSTITFSERQRKNVNKMFSLLPFGFRIFRLIHKNNLYLTSMMNILNRFRLRIQRPNGSKWAQFSVSKICDRPKTKKGNKNEVIAWLRFLHFAALATLSLILSFDSNWDDVAIFGHVHPLTFPCRWSDERFNLPGGLFSWWIFSFHFALFDSITSIYFSINSIVVWRKKEIEKVHHRLICEHHWIGQSN